MDNQRDDFNSRFTELSLKLDEIPRALAAMQTPSPSFTFRVAEHDKLSLQNHTHRRESAMRSGGGGPYTDLQPFTIPDDMKAKVEMRIRQREMLKEEADAKANAELAEAYRRLLLASNPRLSEVRIQVDQCQEQITRAFQMIRESNLHLYSCCESKVEKMDFSAIQSELKGLRTRLRELEIAGPHRIKHPPQPQNLTLLKHAAHGSTTSNGSHSNQQPTEIDSLVVVTTKDPSRNPKSYPGPTGVQLTVSQIPELRVCLLELSRNFNVLKHQWKKQQPPHTAKSVNPIVKTHLEKVVAMISDAYSVTAEEPVDLASVAQHVEKVSRVLGSDFSMQILGTMGCRNPQDESLRRSIAANDIVPALCRYSEVFTEYLRSEDSGNRASAASQLPATELSRESKGSLGKISMEIEELTRNQRRLEDALAELGKAPLASISASKPATDAIASKMVAPSLKASNSASSSPTESAEDGGLKSVSEELQHLKEQMVSMKKQFVTEEAFGEILRQLETWKSESDKRNTAVGVVGHRYVSGAPSSSSVTPGSLMHPGGGGFKRHNSAGGTGLIDALADPLTLIGLDPTADRPKSQAKLDPLQIHKLNGEVRPGRAQVHLASSASSPSYHGTSPIATTISSNGGTVLSGRASALSKLQQRSQMMRPRSSVQQHPNDGHS